ACAFLVVFLRAMLKKETYLLDKKYEEELARHAGLSRKLEEIRRKKSGLAKDLARLSELYALTKQMSFNIRFKELFASLRGFLNDNFRFGKFKIVLFKSEKDKSTSYNTYEISAASESRGEKS
ncbi:unnamed protein product, partial [marine sediment metagenome]